MDKNFLISTYSDNNFYLEVLDYDIVVPPGFIDSFPCYKVRALPGQNVCVDASWIRADLIGPGRLYEFCDFPFKKFGYKQISIFDL